MSLTVLAREAGLKLGTVSPMVDRLEASGFITRKQDSTDRRRVVLAAVTVATDRAGEVYRGQSAAMAELLDGHAETDFNLLMVFLDRVTATLAIAHRALTERDYSEQAEE